jgi:hypothetical protein
VRVVQNVKCTSRATRKAEVHLWLVTKPQADLILSLATSKYYQK